MTTDSTTNNDLISRSHFDKRVRLAGGSCEGEVSADFLDGVLSVLELLKTEPSVEPSGWISVEDRLPESEEYVLCCTLAKNGTQNIIRGYYSNGMWRVGMNSNVTHWMPLPKLPKEGEDDA